MNLPNRISLFRLILIPVIIIVWAFPYKQFGIELPSFYILATSFTIDNVIVLFLFIIASVSDFLDGFIARKNNMITTFGKFIDPIADKALTTTLFVLLACKGIISYLPVVIMICRDIIVDGCRMMAASNGKVVAASIYGKLKTVSQMITIILGIIMNFPFESFGIPALSIMLWFSTIMSVISGINYYNNTKDLILTSK